MYTITLARPYAASLEAAVGRQRLVLRPPSPWHLEGIELDRGALFRLSIEGVEFLDGDGLSAVMLGAGAGVSVKVLECSRCGAPLPFDPSFPLCVCEYCRAVSTVLMPGEGRQPTDFARRFCAELPIVEPSTGLVLEVEGPCRVAVWGQRLIR